MDEVRRQCIQYTVMLLQGTLHLEPMNARDLTAVTHKNNPFLQIMVNRDPLPQGFLAEMIHNTYHDYELFSNVSLCHRVFPSLLIILLNQTDVRI